MSANDHLSEHQFYNRHMPGYDAGNKVSPTSFGVPVTPRPPGLLRESGLRYSPEDYEVDVPLSQVHAQQDYVFDRHVQNLASVPRGEFEKINAVPEVRAHHDGTYRLNEGHHRAAAASLRGDESLRVRVSGRWDPL